MNFNKKNMLFFVSMILIGNFISLTIFYLNPKFQRENWRGAANFIKENKTPNEAIVFENNNEFSPFIYYYSSAQDVIYGLKTVPAKSSSDINPINDKYKKIYVFEYLIDITDQNRFLEKSLKENGFQETNTKNFNGVGFIKIYER